MQSAIETTISSTIQSSLPTLLTAYLTIITMGTTIGAWRGFINWTEWIQTRKYRRVVYSHLEPIVNTTCDVGVLMLNITSTGISSGFVTATFPVSVPMLLALTEIKGK